MPNPLPTNEQFADLFRAKSGLSEKNLQTMNNYLF